MPERPRIPLPFGGGLDRATGTMQVEPTSFLDLRNVELAVGRAALRRGLHRTLTFPDATAIVGIYPVRSQGVGAVVTWDEATRKVELYLVSGDGLAASYVGTVWTLPVGAARPRIIAADSYDRLFLAHDEPFYLNRGVTRVYRPTEGTITDLTADLDRSGTAQPIRFRGVAKHLSYIFGWGYGSAAAGDDDRPEVVRVSLPGQPDVFQPEHYFLAGQRGDPVLACALSGSTLAVRKESESYEIFGYDRATFGIRPVEPFGVAASRLSIVVGAANYYWSLHGPRVAEGGPSRDLAFPLHLDGAVPDALAELTERLADGFVVYRPDTRVVEFVFGRWGFRLHLADDAPRWSYAEYGVELATGGILYASDEATLGPLARATFTAAVAVAMPADGTDHDAAPVDVTYGVDTTAGGLIGGELIEVWGRSALGGGWQKLASQAAVEAGGVVRALAPNFGTDYELAVRLTRAGLASEGYTSVSPLDWPADAQGAVTTLIPVPDLAFGVPAWERVDAESTRLNFRYHGAARGHAELTHAVEVSLDGVAWTPWLSYDGNEVPDDRPYSIPKEQEGVTLHFRMRSFTAGVDSGWSAPISRVAGLAPPANFHAAQTCLGTPPESYPHAALTWDALDVSGPGAAVELERAEDVADPQPTDWIFAHLVPAPATHYDDPLGEVDGEGMTWLPPGTPVHYRARTLLGTDASAWVQLPPILVPDCVGGP